MKYKERDALVDSLRELADFIEQKGLELPMVPDVSVSLHIPFYKKEPKSNYEQYTEKEKKAIVKKVIRLLKPVKKEYSGNYFSITRKFGEKITMKMGVNREVVCKAVPTGNKTVHAAHYVPELIIEEVEWVCTDPILKATEAA